MCGLRVHNQYGPLSSCNIITAAEEYLSFNWKEKKSKGDESEIGSSHAFMKEAKCYHISDSFNNYVTNINEVFLKAYHSWGRESGWIRAGASSTGSPTPVRHSQSQLNLNLRRMFRAYQVAPVGIQVQEPRNWTKARPSRQLLLVSSQLRSLLAQLTSVAELKPFWSSLLTALPPRWRFARC